jgi:hypothetical protein
MKTIKFTFRQDLITELKGKRNSIIGIDGDTGSGKTNLSYFLGANLLKNVINLDDFINSRQDSILNALDYTRLKQRISCLKNPIIEGICLLDVLERINIKHDIFIYCKEISDIENWSSAYRLDIIEQDDYQRQIENHQGLDIEIIRYHYYYRPFEKADYIYEIINQQKA